MGDGFMRYIAKALYGGESIWIGSIEGGFEEILRKVRMNIESSGRLKIGIATEDGGVVSVNCEEDMKKVRRGNGELRIIVEDDYRGMEAVKEDEEEVVRIEMALRCLKCVFSVFVSGEFKGVGLLVNLKVGMTINKVLQGISQTRNAQIYFEDQLAPYFINTDSCFIVSDLLVFFTFVSLFELSELDELYISSVPLPGSQFKAIALANNHAQDIIEKIRYVSVRTNYSGRLCFGTLNPGGPAGGPLFDLNWQLLGIQLTSSSRSNEAIPCSEILYGLKQLPYNNKVIKLIQSIEPQTNEDLSYEQANLAHPILPNRVFGISADKKSIVSCNIKTSQNSSITPAEKLSEGTSICVFPNGLLVSGGKSSLQKAYVLFFNGLSQWFHIEMSQAHCSHASLYFDRKIYLIGGKNSVRPINNCEMFDYQSCKFESIKGLRFTRSNPAAIAFKSTIYVFGGDSGEEDLDTIEYFENDRWKLHCIKMPFRLYGMACVGINDEQVVIFGGLNRMMKFNLKILTVDFEREKVKIENSEERVGVCNGMQICENDLAAFVYNNSGELIKYCKNSRELVKQRNHIICGFINE